MLACASTGSATSLYDHWAYRNGLVKIKRPKI